jgi:protein-L-isoaspartate(D-aspartate) O-methyltransferase
LNHRAVFEQTPAGKPVGRLHILEIFEGERKLWYTSQDCSLFGFPGEMNACLYLTLILAASGLVSCLDPAFNRSPMTRNEEGFAQERRRMVQEQIIARGVRDSRVIAAMEKVPRHLFIPEENRRVSYEDGPVPIGHGQTISQPYIVALMTESLELKPGDKVFEVGTGSGYQAAVLEELGCETFTIEIIPELAQFAAENLRRAGYDAVKVKTGDGYRGWGEFAPFDAIIVTCAPEDIPGALTEQLKEGGRIVVPVGPENRIQELILVRKVKGELVRRSLAPVRFVPMVREE